MDYHSHLLAVIEPFEAASEALADCKRRFKNLPDRHFASVERLVRNHFKTNRLTMRQSGRIPADSARSA